MRRKEMVNRVIEILKQRGSLDTFCCRYGGGPALEVFSTIPGRGMNFEFHVTAQHPESTLLTVKSLFESIVNSAKLEISKRPLSKTGYYDVVELPTLDKNGQVVKVYAYIGTEPKNEHSKWFTAGYCVELNSLVKQ